ncbi:MAG: hypothetical protein LHW46_00935 [Candidatus Cloacimonetes bacterium]|nr:hypothetical protein [Candidatus Cloacimonadota bacterium]
MGFWDTVKSVAISAKCMTGWHAGNYEHVKGQPLCFLGKTCPDCGEYVTKNDHKYGDWSFKRHDRCDAVRECIHCGALDTQVRHDHKKEGKDANCHIIEVCTRCGDKQIGRAEHTWINIPFTNSEMKIQGKRKCKDCGFMG